MWHRFRRWFGASVARKLSLATLIPLFLVAGSIGGLAVWGIADLTNRNVEQAATNLVATEAAHVESFLAERGRVVDTMLANVHLRRYFADLRERGRDVSADSEAQALFQTFAAIVATDPFVQSTFFASAFTGEYFDATGRVEIANYDARQRWWWPQAVQKGSMYVQPPASDADTGQVVVAIKTPVVDDGELIGVAGVDVDLGTIGERISRINFSGTGAAFLIAEGGRLVYFPRLDFEKLKTVGRQLEVSVADLDRLFHESTAGFAELGAKMLAEESGTGIVTLDGKKHRVFFSPVVLDHPQVRWSLALAVPQSVVHGPISRALVLSIACLALTLGLVAFVITTSTRALVHRPIQLLADRLRDIAQGGGDLTLRLETSSADELGQLAKIFNEFVEQIQHDISAIASQARRLQESAAAMGTLGEQIGASGGDSAHRLDTILSAAHEVSNSMNVAASGVTQMDASIREIAARASEAAEVAGRAVSISGSSTSRFDELSSSAQKIGNFVKVIQSIAEQTNLLALNATIEAARAGDAGKGFAVVADEVKELAGEAGNASQEIRSLVGGIQQHSETVQTSSGEVATIISRINEIQMVIASAVEQQSATTAEINRNVSMAAGSSTDIAANLQGIADLVRSSAETAATVEGASLELTTMAGELTRVVQRFTF